MFLRDDHTWRVTALNFFSFHFLFFFFPLDVSSHICSEAAHQARRGGIGTAFERVSDLHTHPLGRAFIGPITR